MDYKQVGNKVEFDGKTYEAVREERAGFCTGCDLRKIENCEEMFNCAYEDRSVYKLVKED